jgi:small conductance mechanosensitive channel
MVFRIGHREDIAKGEWSIEFIVRPWVRTEDYWDVYHGGTRMVKERFDAEGIALPYPQRSIHLHWEVAVLKGE